MRTKDQISESHRKYREKNAERLKAYEAARRLTHNAAALANYYRNPDKKRKQHRDWIAANPEQHRANKQAWDAENKAHVSEYGRQYRAEHPEQVAEMFRVWRKKNPERMRAHANRRRAIKVKSGGTYTAAEIESLWGKQAGKCVYFSVCGNQLTRHQGFFGTHRDHIEPLQPLDPTRPPGSNAIDNIQLLCQECNNTKKNQDPYRFTQEYAGRLFPDLP